MVRKDYILRLIEETARALAHILRMKDMERYAEAVLVLQTFGAKVLPDFDYAEITTVADDDLLNPLYWSGCLDKERCRLLVQLLNEEGELHGLMLNHDHADRCYKTALRLVTELFQQEHEHLTAEDREMLEILSSKVALTECDITLQKHLFEVFEREGHLDRAETLLFSIAEYEPTGRALGLEFYKRLECLSDKELAAGKFSRIEIKQGLHDILLLTQTNKTNE